MKRGSKDNLQWKQRAKGEGILVVSKEGGWWVVGMEEGQILGVEDGKGLRHNSRSPFNRL